jgi:hypothetical protein
VVISALKFFRFFKSIDFHFVFLLVQHFDLVIIQLSTTGQRVTGNG